MKELPTPQRLRELRLAAGLTAPQAARLANVSRATLLRYESCPTGQPATRLHVFAMLRAAADAVAKAEGLAPSPARPASAPPAPAEVSPAPRRSLDVPIGEVFTR